MRAYSHVHTRRDGWPRIRRFSKSRAPERGIHADRGGGQFYNVDFRASSQLREAVGTPPFRSNLVVDQNPNPLASRNSRRRILAKGPGASRQADCQAGGRDVTDSLPTVTSQPKSYLFALMH